MIPKQNNLEQRVDTSTMRVVALVKATSPLKGYFAHRHLLLLIYVTVTATSIKDHVGHYIKILTQILQNLVPSDRRKTLHSKSAEICSVLLVTLIICTWVRKGTSKETTP